MSSRVLIIEDEVVTQHLLTRLIESEGHPVSVAQSAGRVVAALRDADWKRYPPQELSS